ncbi:MAG: EF-hand domain-containing protein, partial [Alphaproteobacteria bacterium]|nr:EF-hand domain-containing protein [Alphaproteobacteria bacterium]
RPQFENGCLVAKCPKMAQFAQKMDTNQDGCISKDEFRTAKKQFKAELRMYELNMQAQELAAQQAALLHKQQQQQATTSTSY